MAEQTPEQKKIVDNAIERQDLSILGQNMPLSEKQFIALKGIAWKVNDVFAWKHLSSYGFDDHKAWGLPVLNDHDQVIWRTDVLSFFMFNHRGKLACSDRMSGQDQERKKKWMDWVEAGLFFDQTHPQELPNKKVDDLMLLALSGRHDWVLDLEKHLKRPIQDLYRPNHGALYYLDHPEVQSHWGASLSLGHGNTALFFKQRFPDSKLKWKGKQIKDDETVNLDVSVVKPSKEWMSSLMINLMFEAKGMVVGSAMDQKDFIVRDDVEKTWALVMDPKSTHYLGAMQAFWLILSQVAKSCKENYSPEKNSIAHQWKEYKWNQSKNDSWLAYAFLSAHQNKDSIVQHWRDDWKNSWDSVHVKNKDALNWTGLKKVVLKTLLSKKEWDRIQWLEGNEADRSSERAFLDERQEMEMQWNQQWDLWLKTMQWDLPKGISLNEKTELKPQDPVELWALQGLVWFWKSRYDFELKSSETFTVDVPLVDMAPQDNYHQKLKNIWQENPDILNLPLTLLKGKTLWHHWVWNGCWHEMKEVMEIQAQWVKNNERDLFVPLEMPLNWMKHKEWTTLSKALEDLPAHFWPQPQEGMQIHPWLEVLRQEQWDVFWKWVEVSPSWMHAIPFGQEMTFFELSQDASKFNQWLESNHVRGLEKDLQDKVQTFMEQAFLRENLQSMDSEDALQKGGVSPRKKSIRL